MRAVNRNRVRGLAIFRARRERDACAASAAKTRLKPAGRICFGDNLLPALELLRPKINFHLTIDSGVEVC
jgi:hypothetical protein